MFDKRTIQLLGSGVIVVLLAVGYFFVAAPLMAEVQRTTEEIDAAEANNQSQQTLVNQLETVRDNEPVITEYNNELSNQFPPTADPDGLRNQIYNIAATNNVQATVTTEVPIIIPGSVPGASDSEENVEPISQDTDGTTASAPTSALASMGIGVTAEGGESDLLNFLADLEGISRVISPTAVTLSSNDENYTLEVPTISYLYQTVSPPENEATEAPAEEEAADADDTEPTDEG